MGPFFIMVLSRCCPVGEGRMGEGVSLRIFLRSKWLICKIVLPLTKFRSGRMVKILGFFFYSGMGMKGNGVIPTWRGWNSFPGEIFVCVRWFWCEMVPSLAKLWTDYILRNYHYSGIFWLWHGTPPMLIPWDWEAASWKLRGNYKKGTL